MKVIINGEEMRFDKALSVDDMIQRLKCDPKRVAIERNLEIVPRSEYTSTPLEEGDKVEIIGFMGGG